MINKVTTFQSSLPTVFPPSWAKSWGEDGYGLYIDLVFDETITQRFRWIAAGDFLMGSSKDEPERTASENQHKVTLAQGYWLADTTVTQALWQLIMDNNPVHFKRDALNPVGEVSWDDSQQFMDALNEVYLNDLHGLVFRLPSEAEWEHACRAGTVTPFSFGEKVTSEQVNFHGSNPYNNHEKSEYRDKIVAVKSLPPNAWGLYEMHGNVWEWCSDAWQTSLRAMPTVDPCYSSAENTDRVLRGGSWSSNGGSCRSASRIKGMPDDRYVDVGFRLSLGHELRARSAK